jgi:hypothetical protein
MCMHIDPEIKSLNKRTVWKVFDRVEGNRILSLFMAHSYPKGKLIERGRRFSLQPSPCRHTRGLVEGIIQESQCALLALRASHRSTRR